MYCVIYIVHVQCASFLVDVDLVFQCDFVFIVKCFQRFDVIVNMSCDL